MESYYIVFILFLIVIMYSVRQRNLSVLLHRIRKKKRGKAKMTELIEKYIGKECLIYTCSSSTQITGIIHCCKDGWIEVENNGQRDIVNCEYITRIREYPRNKKGKKKSIITD